MVWLPICKYTPVFYIVYTYSGVTPSGMGDQQLPRNNKTYQSTRPVRNL